VRVIEPASLCAEVESQLAQALSQYASASN
jgi:hypothetical protein